jgi:hypothetical protein
MSPRMIFLVRLLGVILLTAGVAREARAQDSTAVDVLYMKEGAVIRGQILADNGPNGIRIRSQQSGATFVVPAAQIDSVVKYKAPAPVPLPAVLATAPASVIESAPPAAVKVSPPQTQDSAPSSAQPQVVITKAAPPPTIVVAPTPIREGLAPPPGAVPASEVVVPAVPDTTPPDTAAHRTTVTFISGTEIYIGAGRLDGLLEGSEVSVMQGDEVVGTLRVKFLASHRSACVVVSGASGIALGDVIQFHSQPASPEMLSASAVAARIRPRRMSGPGLHGRFGTRYMRATTTTVDGGQELGSNGFNQPSLDARINGIGLGGTPLGLALDLRTRQTTSTSAGGTQVDGHTRVYQAVMFWNQPGSSFRAAAGRQYLTAVSSIGLFDGALAELNGGRISFGAFAGFEPDIATLGFSSAVHDFGAYVSMHNRPGTSTVTSATIGAVGSYEGGEARREWGIAQFTMNNRYVSLYLLQELDYYRPWKLEGPNAEQSAISATSQFANVSLRPTRWLAINGTYDKRRSVPTLRDFTNPETEFDDAYRQGYGGGVQLTGQQVYGGGDWRRSTGGSSGGANSFTSTLGVNRITKFNVGLSARATWYQNDVFSADTTVSVMHTSGQLYSGRLSIDPFGPIHLDLSAGLRQEDNPIAAGLQKSTWYGVDADMNLGRAWFMSFSVLRQNDSVNPGTSTLTQFYGGLTWRF